MKILRLLKNGVKSLCLEVFICFSSTILVLLLLPLCLCIQLLSVFLLIHGTEAFLFLRDSGFILSWQQSAPWVAFLSLALVLVFFCFSAPYKIFARSKQYKELNFWEKKEKELEIKKSLGTVYLKSLSLREHEKAFPLTFSYLAQGDFFRLQDVCFLSNSQDKMMPLPYSIEILKKEAETAPPALQELLRQASVYLSILSELGSDKRKSGKYCKSKLKKEATFGEFPCLK